MICPHLGRPSASPAMSCSSRALRAWLPRGALGAAKGAQMMARSAAKPWLQAARRLQQSTYLMPARPISALSSTGRRLPFEGYERIGRHYLEELPGNLLAAEKTPLPGTYTWVQGMPIEPRLLKQGVIKVLPDGKLLVRSRKGDLVFDPKKGIPRFVFPEPALPLDPASTFLKSEGGGTLTRSPGTLAPPRGYTPSTSTTLLSRRMTSAAPTVAIRTTGTPRADIAGCDARTRPVDHAWHPDRTCPRD